MPQDLPELPALDPDEVRAFRLNLELSQDEFGRLFGMTRKGVLRWEKEGAPGHFRYSFAAIDQGVKPWFGKWEVTYHGSEEGRSLQVSDSLYSSLAEATGAAVRRADDMPNVRRVLIHFKNVIARNLRRGEDGAWRRPKEV